MNMLLQIFILICLLAVIFLLLMEKIHIEKGNKPLSENREEVKPSADIMGRANDVRKQRPSGDKIGHNPIITEPIPEVVAAEKNVQIALPPSMPVVVDYAVNEEWDEEFPPHDERFSQGVSLEELTLVGKLLQQNTLESAQQDLIIDVVQKVQGTELFSLLEDSIEGASKRIAVLLDKTLERKHVNSTQIQGSEFDIDNFV